jgi:hypothetical protein
MTSLYVSKLAFLLLLWTAIAALAWLSHRSTR